MEVEKDRFKLQVSETMNLIIAVGEGPYSEGAVDDVITTRRKIVDNFKGEKWCQITHFRGSLSFQGKAFDKIVEDETDLGLHHNFVAHIMIMDSVLMKIGMQKLITQLFRISNITTGQIIFVKDIEEAIQSAHYVLD